jgi:hypothetical protein
MLALGAAEARRYALRVMTMEILVKQNDDPEFVESVKHVIAGCINDGFPNKILVIKIDNWFDHKWLGFSGKGRVGFGFYGDYLVDVDTALDEFRQDQITLPPFSPRRVIEEYYFQRVDSGTYSARNPRPYLHERKLAPSSQNLHKRIVDRIDSAILVWFSSNTKQNLRGSIMMYEVKGTEVYPWYAELAKKKVWRVLQTKGITPDQVQSLIKNDSKVRA